MMMNLVSPTHNLAKHTHTHTHTYIHTDTQTYTHAFMHMHTHKHDYIHTMHIDSGVHTVFIMPKK